jgi:hypothetical protein
VPDTPPSALINRITAYLVALLGLAITLYTVIGSIPAFGVVNDLPQYYAAASLLAHGHAADVYNLPALFAQEKADFPQLTRGIGVFLPPPAIPLLLPLLVMSPAIAAYAWYAVLGMALCASLWLTARYFSLDRQQTLWLFGITFLSGPAVEALRVGQLAPLMLLCLVACMCLAQQRPILSGVCLAGLVFKPQQLFPVLVSLAGASRGKVLAAAMILLLGLFVLSHLLFGQAGFGNYTAVVADPANLPLMQPQLNPTVRGQMLRIFGVSSPVPNAVAAIFLILSVLAIFLAGRKTGGRADWLMLTLSVAMPLGLVTSLHCHDYDLILLIPGVVALVKSQLWFEWPAWAKGLVMVGVAPYLIPFYSDIHYGYLLRGGVVNIHFWLLLVYAIVLMGEAFMHAERFRQSDT